jgi:surfactin synthase thioesterase subunit
MRGGTGGAAGAVAPPTPSPYLLPRQPDPGSAPLRLFCFHHAGGAASSFADWQPRLGGSVAVVPIQLPGREHRAREPRLHDFGRLLDELDEALDPLMNQPYAVYGHSMGGLIAYELTRRRLARGRPLPKQLLVGACPPPHAPRAETAPEQLSDDELTAWMTGLGGLPELVLRYPDWLRLSVALLRDDLRLVHSRLGPGEEPADGHPPLSVPIQVLAGARDLLVTPRLAEEWARHTTADCRVFTLPGGHFFHRSSPAIVLRLLSSLLTAGGAVRL